MRIVQIIDSLEVGGAEKMAVNYANTLVDKIEFTGLIATRKEGALKVSLKKEVNYLYLKKNKIIDIVAIYKLAKYCVEHKIDTLHSHSSSYFISFLVKLLLPRIKIIWHDHNGMSAFITKKETFVLKIASFFFKGIIVVNYQLENWAFKQLNCKNVLYLPNFTTLENDVVSSTVLKGLEGKRILCLANLRPQKNHFFLIEIAKKLKGDFPNWTFHLVGKDFNDEYSTKVKETILSNKLQNNVFVYDSRNDIVNIMNQCQIAILTSKSEGLPIAFIEYGLSKMPVVTTKVGEIPLILKDGISGFLVEVNDVELFHQRIKKFIMDEDLRIQFGNALFETIISNHSEGVVIDLYLNWLINTK
ncbi:glycosyltransferase [Flavobacterium sp.]|uniref:glycosyltransferase n=1 Tax=Flavobacterium sp. TaxID=239 RepID=UPI0025F1AD71|nr:glycosyltransferase [Flavobacterium sp.]